MDKIDNIANDIIEIEFNIKKNSDISGNLDARKIKEINQKYGIILEKDNKSLFIIKNQRQKLAHGDEIFSRCGANYTIQELEEIKNESIDYMRFILTHIQEFLINKKYKIEGFFNAN